jgi:hypothetical protein
MQSISSGKNDISPWALPSLPAWEHLFSEIRALSATVHFVKPRASVSP